MPALNQVSRLPAPTDNCAIATRPLQPGTPIHFHKTSFTLRNTILEGHRFAVKDIPAGAYLTSWGFPFGKAIQDIQAGAYLRNDAVLAELNSRNLPFSLPHKPNFTDQIPPHKFDPAAFVPTPAPAYPPASSTFLGYPRPTGRSAGTRNVILLLASSTLAVGFLHALEKRLAPLAREYENIDAIVAVTHTETLSPGANNQSLLLRTLAGFVVHPNTAAALIVDDGGIENPNLQLETHMRENGFPLDQLPHHFFSQSGFFLDDIESASAIIQDWLGPVNQITRVPTATSELKIALQCGGSDSFSGISGNPLAAWVAKALIEQGGSANLAETDELIGAEAYMLDRVGSAATAQRFLDTVERFRKRARSHGHSARSNPSGGNIFRGLYNIFLKSLGAAAKRHPDIRLETVLEYGERISGPGFHFMDSPGNDLESIAGQVASGCSLILFVTGNGSITNFPFVPTLKIVTTTPRFEMLKQDMDINAGAFLDGTPLPELGSRAFSRAIAVASGEKTAGEKAGHAQVQIWRDWPLAAGETSKNRSSPEVTGRPLPVGGHLRIPGWGFMGYPGAAGPVSDLVNLILPTSLCAGQIANILALKANAVRDAGSFRTVALPHTEGCGSTTEAEFIDTILGYATHPLVRHCLFLEHGCEKTHNAYWKNRVMEAGLDQEDFGWASIQMDGGIDAVLQKAAAWFEGQAPGRPKAARRPAGFDSVRIGLVTAAGPTPEAAAHLARLVQAVAGEGQVVIPLHDPLLRETVFLDLLGIDPVTRATSRYAAKPAGPGMHIMQTPSNNWLETTTGLGATGIGLLVAWVEQPLPGSPLVPMLQLAGAESSRSAEVDLPLQAATADMLPTILDRIAATLSGEYLPVAGRTQNTGFQVTRGRMGISL